MTTQQQTVLTDLATTGSFEKSTLEIAEWVLRKTTGQLADKHTGRAATDSFFEQGAKTIKKGINLANHVVNVCSYQQYL